MSQLESSNTSMGDICKAALKECGAVGVGQTPLAEDINDAWARLQWMLMQWEKKRWLVYHLVTLSCVSRGALYYTVGPNGDFDTGSTSMRPSKLSSAFVRQIGFNSGVTPPQTIWDDGQSTWDGGQTLWDTGSSGSAILAGSNNQIDYHLEILESKEDYNRITLKSLMAGPGEAAFLDSDWPTALLYVWPVPQAGIYQIFVSIYMQLPYQFATPASVFEIPFEYYGAMLYNLAMRLRPKYRMGTYPGDPLPGIARDSLAVLRASNTQIARLRMPNAIRRRGLYNIFSDRPY